MSSSESERSADEDRTPSTEEHSEPAPAGVDGSDEEVVAASVSVSAQRTYKKRGSYRPAVH